MFAFSDSDDVEGASVVRTPSWLAPRCVPSPAAGSPAVSLKRGPSAPPPSVADLEPIDLPKYQTVMPPSAGTIERVTTPFHSRIQELEAELAATKAALAEAVANGVRRKAKLLEACEPELGELAVAIARRIVDRELEVDPSLVTRWAREALQSLSEKDVVVAIGGEIAKFVDAAAWSGAIGQEVCVIVDAELPPYGVEVRTRSARVRADAEARSDAVAASLGLSGRR